MSRPEVVVHRDGDLLAAATAARLVTALVDAQAARGSASLVLTGGRTGIAVLEQLRATPARDAVDWTKVDLYWGDERFLPSGHPERNETQEREALLDHVPVPENWIGNRTVEFQTQSRSRIAWIDRLGEGMLPTRETVLQEGDMLHLVIREENAAHAYAVLESGPEDD